MGKEHNSSALAKQVADKLKLNQEESLKLYKELSQIPNGMVKDALDVLSGPADLSNQMVTQIQHKSGGMQKYAAYIRGECVRDSQYSKHPDADPLDDDAWLDAPGMPLFLKIVEAETPTRATQIAAIYAGVNESVIELQPI